MKKTETLKSQKLLDFVVYHVGQRWHFIVNVKWKKICELFCFTGTWWLLDKGNSFDFLYSSCRYAQYGDVSPKVDVYAFGVVLYELISAKDAIVKSTGSGADSKGLVALVSSTEFLGWFRWNIPLLNVSATYWWAQPMNAVWRSVK